MPNEADITWSMARPLLIDALADISTEAANDLNFSYIGSSMIVMARFPQHLAAARGPLVRVFTAAGWKFKEDTRSPHLAFTAPKNLPRPNLRVVR